MEGPGLSFRGREACLVQPRVPAVTWQTSEGFSPEGISATSFSVFPTHSEGWVGVFSLPSLVLWGSPRGTTGEIFPRA